MIIKIKIYISIGLFFFSMHYVYCQDQKKADSIKVIYKSGNYDVPEYRMLTRITEFETNPDSSLFYAKVLIEKAAALKPKDSALKAFRMGYLAKGSALLLKGNPSKSVDAFLKGLDYSEQAKDERYMAYFQISIADTYAVMENNENAEQFYSKGIEMLRKIPDSEVNLASALLNAGDWLFNMKEYERALVYFDESGLIFEDLDYPLGKAYNLGNIGMVYAEQGKDELAEENINEAIIILEELEDYYPISVYLTYLADIYADKGNFDFAFKYANRSLRLAIENGLKEQISKANLKLSELYENIGNLDLTLKYYRDHIIYRDSVRNIAEVQKIGNAMTSKTQAELDLSIAMTSKAQAELGLSIQKGKTNRIITYAIAGALFFIVLIALGLFRRNKFVRATNKIIETEKERSDNLLLNILPKETAQELKENGRVVAKKYPSVTVLFSDFKGFSTYAEHLSPEDLVKTIDYYFSKFDLIMEKYGLEKIKTIGDSYMAAGGLSDTTTDHTKQMVLAALEMANFDIRIGINTGAVVAGVVGTKKFAYDIWGDSVNIASRMESNSEPGRINVAEDTYNIIKSDFKCDYRGEFAVKNRGDLKMYFVNTL